MNLKLDTAAWQSILRGALVAAAGAAATYVYQHLSGAALGDATPVAVALFSVLVNYVRKAAGIGADSQPPAAPSA
jgi:hypothetical protein